jgi:NAD-dependent SIR2 family protein deacetylase
LAKTNKKTVYILGAGFSTPSGGPEQASLIQRIFELPDSDDQTINAKAALKDFLSDVMQVDTSQNIEINLEDVYTPIDRCLADRQSLRDKNTSYLQNLRGQMEFLISLAISKSFETANRKNPNCSDYVNHFAKYLVDIASERGRRATEAMTADEAKAYDPFSIICLNWDILLDKAIFNALQTKDGGRAGDYEPIGVVDYCCYISSVDEGERRIRPGLWTLGARGYNVKLLKLHGSMNWLQCSHCQQVFVSFDEKINIPNYINPLSCRHCSKRDIKSRLRGSLVMPTFLKDLTNFQIKLVWQNAAVELMEADELVFIGYSLPQADFEFRQMLSRMLRKDAEATVVLFHNDQPTSQLKYKEECRRYQQFFGSRSVKTRHDGVEAYVAELTRQQVSSATESKSS